MNFAEQSVPFWGDELVQEIDHPIMVLWDPAREWIRRWPGSKPTMTKAIDELACAETVYIKQSRSNSGDDSTRIKILTGRFSIMAFANPNREGNLRLWLGGISFADDRERSEMLSGARVRIKGVKLLDKANIWNYEKEPYFDSGRYVQDILDLKNQGGLHNGNDSDTGEAEAHISEEQEDVLDTLQQYVDAEYELEELEASQNAPFSYFSMEAQARRTVYRQYYMFKLVQQDYDRIVELKPAMLKISGNDEIVAEVVDFSPSKNEPDILLAIERHTDTSQIPTEGTLLLTSLPTLRNIRTEVIEQLRDGRTKNPWLLSLASNQYEHNPFQMEAIDPPPTDYPPTPSQLEAFRKGVSSKDYTLVLGPPGTGKTTVIINWVRAMVENGLRILVTSQNNKAVDNVLERLVEQDGVKCIRLGNENKVTSSLHDSLLDNAAVKLQKELLDGLDHKLNTLKEMIQFLRAFVTAAETLTPELVELENQKKKIEMHINTLRPLEEELGAYQEGRKNAQRHEDNRIYRLNKYHDWLDEWSHKSLWNKTFSFLKKQMIQINLSRLERQKKHLERIDLLNKKISSIEEKIASSKHAIKPLVAKISQLRTSIAERLPKKTEANLTGIEIPDTPTITGMQQLIDFTNEQKVLADRLEKFFNISQEWSKVISNSRQQALYQMLLSMVDVVGATCIGINTKPIFKEIPFDAVIVDESGQIQLHNLMVPLSRAPAAILVGDHKQLPPVVPPELTEEMNARDINTDLLSKSWFEVLWNQSPKDRKVMLDTQYRCPSVISDFISSAFYGGKYFAGKGMEKKKPLFSFVSSPMVFADTSCFPETERFEQSKNISGQLQVMGNRLETRLIVEILKLALAEKPELGADNEVGIIIPYKRHAVEIRRAIAKEKKKGMLPTLSAPLEELVATVDSFQGQERELIIMGFTRSNQAARVGFLKEWRRLNVAMTRAKSQLVMVGDFSTLASHNGSGTAKEFHHALRSLKQFIHTHGQYMKGKRFNELPHIQRATSVAGKT